MSSSRIVQCFLNADLRSGHVGLAKLARKHALDVQQLGAGEYVVFINAAKNKLKLYAANNVIAYYRSPSRGVIDLRVVANLPRVFTGTSIRYDEALKTVLEKGLQSRDRGSSGAHNIYTKQ